MDFSSRLKSPQENYFGVTTIVRRIKQEFPSEFILSSGFLFSVGNSEKLGNHLSQLLGEAEMRLQEFGYIEDSCSIPINTRASFSSFIGTSYPASAMTGLCHLKNERVSNKYSVYLSRMCWGWQWEASNRLGPQSENVKEISAGFHSSKTAGSTFGGSFRYYRVQFRSDKTSRTN